MNTTMVTSSGGTPGRTVEEGAAAVMSVIAPDAPSGSYFVGQEVGSRTAGPPTLWPGASFRDLRGRLTGSWWPSASA